MKKVYKSHALSSTRPTTVSPTVNKIRAGSKTAKRVPTAQKKAPLCMLECFLILLIFSTPIR